jgi:hypothetical protein
MAENKQIKRPSLKYLRDKYREKVRGVFHFNEVPGGTLDFFYKEFKEDPIERYVLKDGVEYELPLGVAKHLAKDGWYPIHERSVDASGNPLKIVGRKERRFSFESTEFLSMDTAAEMKSEDSRILTVESI